MMGKCKTIIILILVIAVCGIAIFGFVHKRNSPSSKKQQNISSAASTSKLITSQDDWTTGTISGLDATPLGDLKIDLGGGGKFTGGSLSCNGCSGDLNNVKDGDPSTYVTFSNRNQDITWDLGGNYTVSSARYCTNNADIMNGVYYYYESSWHFIGNSNSGTSCWGGHVEYNWWGADSSTSNVSKVKIVTLDPTGSDWPGWTVNIQEFEIYASSTLEGTHTSDATQINGGDNFWGWETFTPTYDKLPNTDVRFRFRTSTNGSDPTDWSAYQTPTSGAPLNISSLVTSRDEGSGDDNSKDAANFTYYKYLQVETTLTSTVGDTTPTVSDYSIGYHTNVKPDKPVAGTAVIGQ